jgi:hypothetical protein
VTATFLLGEYVHLGLGKYDADIKLALALSN